MQNVKKIPCKFCWEEILETAKKCKHCWEFLDEAQKNNAQQPTIHIVNQQNQNTWFDNVFPKKSWGIALFLSIFFWWLGFDRFYLGDWWLGILKLLTGWGFWIWWIIDIVLILTKSVWGIRWK